MGQEHPLMKCGHAANSVVGKKPACVICVGIHPGALVVDDQAPDLAGRIARCGCGAERPSSYDLPFFEIASGPDTWSDEDREAVEAARNTLKAYRYTHRKDRSPESRVEDERLRLESVRLQRVAEARKDISKAPDRFYCGCRGWE